MWLHIILTVVTSLTLLTLPYLATLDLNAVEDPQRYDDNNAINSFKFLGNFNKIAVETFTFLLVSQVIYFINLFLGLYKGSYKLNNQ